ncbi:helix-turn-helix domain-containing protein [Ancylobacter sp. FA202]|uniref:helix-turn-helix domain-containing protein n=1 Tax=Ancylobacter sp. FA202 TaxID=1111106 RepID=UPI0004778E14|nr:XRE family transcriptional regulator [Ancylobacter sp. FA202]
MSNSAKAGDAERRRAFAALLKGKRRDKDLSITELAKIAGIAKSNLARLEAGEGNPSLETLWTLSKALDINVRDLIDPASQSTRFSRVEPDYEARAEDADFRVKLLSTCPIGSVRDIYRAVFQPGKLKISEAHSRGIIEHVIVVSGSARIGPLEKVETLGPGDYFSYSGNQAHVYEALEPYTTAIIIMEGT